MTTNPFFLIGLIILLLLIVVFGLKYYNKKVRNVSVEEQIQDIKIQLEVNELTLAERRALETKLEMLTQRITLRKVED